MFPCYFTILQPPPPLLPGSGPRNEKGPEASAGGGGGEGRGAGGGADKA